MLVTLADMKSYLDLSVNTHDAFLTSQLEVISATVEAYCRRVFTKTAWKQTFYYNDFPLSSKLSLYHYPVVSVTSITYDISTLDASNYRIHKPSGVILRNDYGYFFSNTDVEVIYEAGYDVIPLPVQEVVKSLVAERYNKQTSGVNLNFGSDVQRISIPGSLSIDFDYSLSNNDRSTGFGTILGSYVNVLDAYRSERALIGSSKLEFIEEI